MAQSLLFQRLPVLHPATIPDNGRREGQVQDGREGGQPEPEVEEEEVEGEL